jgi:hypothetical protein
MFLKHDGNLRIDFTMEEVTNYSLLIILFFLKVSVVVHGGVPTHTSVQPLRCAFELAGVSVPDDAWATVFANHLPPLTFGQ